MNERRFSVGFDFGTESVRVVIVAVDNGQIVGMSSHAYQGGVIDHALPGGQPLPPDFALQNPLDWLQSGSMACRAALRSAGVSTSMLVGVGVAFTSCTMLPSLADGTPLCQLPAFQSEPMAWPKLWKHHGAKYETDRLNAIARSCKEPWLGRYGNSIGIEWFFPKIYETVRRAPAAYAAAEVYLEAGDWFVWQLTSGPFPNCRPDQLARSTCQAGYKACWNAESGFSSTAFFEAVDPQLRDVVKTKIPGRLHAPGTVAGLLTPAAAQLLSLPAGLPISAAIIDAHAGVPGAGVCEDGTLVLVMGTSSCHMLNSSIERLAPGIAGVVWDGILPGLFGYETGQASVGDAFAWVVNTFGTTHADMNHKCKILPPGSGGVLAIDWLNGCRTPLMDGHLSGSFIGLTLNTKPEQMYRALLEATAFGVRWIVETLRTAGVPVKKFVASGGLPPKNPLLMQIYADVLGETIALAESDQSVALGAAILGRLASDSEASDRPSPTQAVHAMARQRPDLHYVPDPTAHKRYSQLYSIYRSLTAPQGILADAMHELRALTQQESSFDEYA